MKQSRNPLTLLSLFLLFFVSAVNSSASFRSQPVIAPGSTIAKGIAWLEANQGSSGAWGAPAALRDTATAAQALGAAGGRSRGLWPALAWLANRPARDNVERARVLGVVGRPLVTDKLIAALKAAQNPVDTTKTRPNAPEGGWGVAAGYSSDILSTALALRALSATTADAKLSLAASYLVAAQNVDGGWPAMRGDSSSVDMTAQAALSLLPFRNVAGVTAALSKAQQFLLLRQKVGGGWGAGNGTAIETAQALRALRALNAPAARSDKARAFLVSLQDANGSWNNRVYDTALALIALSESRVHVPLVRL